MRDAGIESQVQDLPTVFKNIDMPEIVPEVSDTTGNSNPLFPQRRYSMAS
jgi:hypothetical protein